VRAIGFGGFIPYLIGLSFGALFARKMLDSKKRYVKVIFWALFAAIFLLGPLLSSSNMF